MVESKRAVSGNLDGKTFSVFQPNSMTRRLFELGNFLSQSLQQILTAYKLRSGTPSEWPFLIQLSCNASHFLLAPKLFAKIVFPLDCWNRCAFYELINDIYTAPTGCLGRYCGIQSEEQHHSTFSNIFLCRKLCEAVIFVCEQETWGFFNPTNWHRMKQVLSMKPSHLSWR